MRPDLFERILVSLHEAVLDDELWPAASGLIDEGCGSKGNLLITGDGMSPDAARGGVDPTLVGGVLGSAQS